MSDSRPEPTCQTPTAAAVMIGDELLSGKVGDTNAEHLIHSFRELGCALRRIVFIPDDIETIGQEVLACSRGYDHVITSGGVGPTHDDVTLFALARAFSSKLVRHPDLVEEIRRFLGPNPSEATLSMADVPAVAELVRDSADQPLTIVRIENVYCLPGEPTFFRGVFDSIRDRFRGTPFHYHRIYTSLDEGAIADLLRANQEAHPAVSIGSYPRFDCKDHRVLVTIDSRSPRAARSAYESVLAALPAHAVVRSE